MKIPFVIFVLLALAGCGEKLPVKSRALTDEYLIINLALKNTVVDDELFKRNIIDGYNPEQYANSLSDDEREQRYNDYDSIKNRFDTVRPSLFVKDTLYQSPVFDLDFYKQQTIEELKKNNIKETELLKEIVSSVIVDSTVHKIDINQIDQVYTYHMYFNKKDPHIPEVMLYRGTITINGPSLNKEKNMACIGVELKCGDPCGYRDIVFMKKKGNHWEIVYKNMVAVY